MPLFKTIRVNDHYRVSKDDVLLSEVVRSKMFGRAKKWAVFGQDGQKLSKWYTSKKDAVARLRQIDYWKHQG